MTTNELIPINLPAALEAACRDEWSHIDPDMINTALVIPLKPKYALEWEGKKLLEGWQAGVRVNVARWYWSRRVYKTSDEAEAAARMKAAELVKGK